MSMLSWNNKFSGEYFFKVSFKTVKKIRENMQENPPKLQNNIQYTLKSHQYTYKNEVWTRFCLCLLLGENGFQISSFNSLQLETKKKIRTYIVSEENFTGWKQESWQGDQYNIYCGSQEKIQNCVSSTTVSNFAFASLHIGWVNLNWQY